MKRHWPLLLVALLSLVACSKSTDAPTAPSPLAALDPDRLYLLVRAGGGVKPVCRDYFAAPTSAPERPFEAECRGWQSLMTAHLQLNGIEDLQPAHLEDVTYWRWWDHVQAAIATCREAVRKQDQARREAKTPGWRLPDTAAFRDCDPFDKAIQGEGKTLADLRIITGRAEP